MDISILKIHRKAALVVSLGYTSNKCVKIYRDPEAGDRYHCGILDLYISKLPSETKEKDSFYVCSMEKTNSSTPTWEICGTIGVAISLHKWYQKFASLQISEVTRQTNGLLVLLNYEAERQRYQKRTGHCSLKCLLTWTYKWQSAPTSFQYPIIYLAIILSYTNSQAVYQ